MASERARCGGLWRQVLAVAIAALLGLASAPGCSWTFMKPAPDQAATQLAEPPRCSEKPGWAIWDTALGTSAIIVGGVQLAVAHDTGRSGLTRALGVANLAAGGLYLASALLGYARADRCAEARDAYFELARDRARGKSGS
jgi:hypothetical protein